jgi:hypothetical protein
MINLWFGEDDAEVSLLLRSGIESMYESGTCALSGDEMGEPDWGDGCSGLLTH